MMVCPYDDKRLLLILQVDHSRVTGWFAAHWGNDAFARPSPYAAMVLAAQEHDTGWWDWEIKPQINNEGLPPDYIGSIKHLGGKVWLDFYRHGIDRLAEQDPYAGYIVSCTPTVCSLKAGGCSHTCRITRFIPRSKNFSPNRRAIAPN